MWERVGEAVRRERGESPKVLGPLRRDRESGVCHQKEKTRSKELKTGIRQTINAKKNRCCVCVYVWDDESGSPRSHAVRRAVSPSGTHARTPTHVPAGYMKGTKSPRGGEASFEKKIITTVDGIRQPFNTSAPRRCPLPTTLCARTA